MKPIRTRLVAVAAAVTTIAVAVPAATASADTVAPAVWEGSRPVVIELAGPVVGQAAVVIGPAIITSSPASFVNTNNQVSAGGVWSGGQLAG